MILKYIFSRLAVLAALAVMVHPESTQSLPFPFLKKKPLRTERLLAGTSPICPTSPVGPYSLGDTTQICVFVGMLGSSVNDSSIVRTIFQVTVDDLVVPDLTGTFIEALSYGTDGDRRAYAWVSTKQTENAFALDCLTSATKAAGGRDTSVSCPTVYAINDRFAVFSSLTINMEAGEVKSLNWDNKCDGVCTSSDAGACLQAYHTLTLVGPDLQWEENTTSTKVAADRGGVCSDPRGTCEEKTNHDSKESLCDFRFFLSWQGDDKNGNYAMSSGSRMSRFPSSMLKHFLEKAAPLFEPGGGSSSSSSGSSSSGSSSSSENGTSGGWGSWFGLKS
uniref:Uncharacterized protein n=1 Tax=Chromera velia CCMP2878 TaxID=1169474 RepID=A0A0G4HN57_9ALVE|mmetsp:Transcript_6280/g.12423  ORF Transcript_6280/g.12423 Transcript_6280/m.12423 type:complete len:334 (+) Transcript_6280:182-1183(+)|eukprot:Cvel_29364.t1-p1 / transcript=Cvel_29364.t1 / gene=Cvel_29364 / organism=Chromera_velia_CCMP2878 / gene_product=hypothetical protein / transcript_product=hypothetical protein / location=Cvel_scaffold4001:7005-10123(-) / protein_length=333 / sequence_SO=supercontig / SO=protein_coding / is_pseudo=false